MSNKKGHICGLFYCCKFLDVNLINGKNYESIHECRYGRHHRGDALG